MAALGRRIYSQNIVLRGKLAEADWRVFLLECISAMGMTAAGEAGLWSYPTETGKGGLGVTICQPMTESFIVVDCWPDWDGAYLHISSCRRFNPADLVRPMKAFGLGVELMGSWEALRL